MFFIMLLLCVLLYEHIYCDYFEFKVISSVNENFNYEYGNNYKLAIAS